VSAASRIAAPRASPRRPTADAGDAVAPIAILAPTGRDAAVSGMVLSEARFTTRICADITELGEAVRDEAGVLLVAEEALTGPARDALLAVLEAQPSWSDIPVVLLTGEGELSRGLSPTLDALATRANVTLLERPVRVATLVTTMRSALRARRRQFDVRDHLDARAVAETALRAARQEAEAASRAKGEFLAVMSHELRTPLNAIGGYAELIEMGLRGPITEEQRVDLARIQQSQKHLLGLINQVLNYTRVETGTVRYDLVDVRVAEALAAAEALVVPQVRAKGLGYTFGTCDPSLSVRADRDKLQQVLLNLLTNAIKFTSAGGEITVTCSSTDVTVAIRVTDTGVGIPPDKLAVIFEPFVQIDSRLTRAQDGVGLGLAISRDLARGMGGELTAASVEGTGSTFTLSLPKA
jgi:signal transduction histidine kinase